MAVLRIHNNPDKTISRQIIKKELVFDFEPLPVEGHDIPYILKNVLKADLVLLLIEPVNPDPNRVEFNHVKPATISYDEVPPYAVLETGRFSLLSQKHPLRALILFHFHFQSDMEARK